MGLGAGNRKYSYDYYHNPNLFKRKVILEKFENVYSLNSRYGIYGIAIGSRNNTIIGVRALAIGNNERNERQ